MAILSRLVSDCNININSAQRCLLVLVKLQNCFAKYTIVPLHCKLQGPVSTAQGDHADQLDLVCFVWKPFLRYGALIEGDASEVQQDCAQQFDIWLRLSANARVMSIGHHPPGQDLLRLLFSGAVFRSQ